MWARATDIHRYLHSEGNRKFSAMVSLSRIFGYCENFNKVMYGAKHELILGRTDDIDSMIRSSRKNTEGSDETTSGKVNLTKLGWRMAIIKLSGKYKLELLADIEDKKILPVEFLSRHCESLELNNNQRNLDWRLSVSTGSERPRYVILGF